MNSAKPEIIIRRLRSADSFEKLTELLHRSYKSLADMGLRFFATHQGVNVTRGRANKGICFVAESESRIIGTITFYDSDRTAGSPFLNKKGVGHLGQLAVEPEFQKQGFGARLISTAEAYARSRGDEWLAIDTADSAEHLIRWYERLGYRFVEYTCWDVTNYRSVIMSKRL
jgi:GNAT superfamily N-acetyltransferase